MRKLICRSMKHISDSHDVAKRFLQYVHGYLEDIHVDADSLSLQLSANTLEIFASY